METSPHGPEYIANFGAASFTQSGGNNTVGTPAANNDLYVGTYVHALGTYTLNNAAASLSVNGDEFVGYTATGTSSNSTITQYGGTFFQSAGNHTITGALNLAANAGSSGSFTLAGGNLTVGGGVYVGGISTAVRRHRHP